MINFVFIGNFCAASSIASFATASDTPSHSNKMRPGSTTAAKYSGNNASVTAASMLAEYGLESNVNSIVNSASASMSGCSIMITSTSRMYNPDQDSSGNSGTGFDAPTAPVSELRSGDLVSAYPNPANDKVTFKYSVPDAQGKITLSVTSAIGARIAIITTTESNGQMVWETGNIAAGVYLYGLSDDNGLIATGRIIIIR